jgi:uncharacterized protein (DUF58 family)
MRNFVPLLVVLLVIALTLRVDFFVTVVYFLAALYVLSRLWMGRAIRHLGVRRAFTDHAFTGDLVTVDLTVRNVDWLPIPWVEVSESLPVRLMAVPFDRQVITLGPYGEWHYRYTLACRHRGYYDIGPLSLELGDLLGLAHRTGQGAEPKRLTVYPRVVALHELGLPTHSPMVALPVQSPLFEDASRIMGVRDYQRGDAMRRVHWTATARTGRLVVKQYQPAIARETLICLDLDEDDYEITRRYPATELAIVAAASIASHIILKEGLAVGLITEAVDPLVGAERYIALPPRAERAHLMTNILETLARVQMTQGAAFTELLHRAGVHASWGTTFVVITGGASQALFDTLLGLRRRGFSVTLILAQPDVAAHEWQEQAARIGMPLLEAWSDRDLETWR